MLDTPVRHEQSHRPPCIDVDEVRARLDTRATASVQEAQP
jgi:hypothetical protein